jgi:branched-subunit amino acid transport protein
VNRIWSAVLLSGAVTFAMRASFLAAANRLTQVPPGVQRLLRQIPPAALGALVLPALVRPHGAFDLLQPRLVAGVLAGIVAWRTNNIALTLAVGLGVLIPIEVL